MGIEPEIDQNTAKLCIYFTGSLRSAAHRTADCEIDPRGQQNVVPQHWSVIGLLSRGVAQRSLMIGLLRKVVP